MSINPFDIKPKKIDDCNLSWQDISVKPYDKKTVDPYTKTRVILMNGTEYESVWFSHRFHRREADNDIRRALATTRRQEQQQQKMIANLKPINEIPLETTISYEQLAVDLTAFLARRATNKNFKNTLDFALLEDFDHLYRYSDLLLNDNGIKGEDLVGHYTEIMPGRPTIAHHRHPADTVKKQVVAEKCDLMTTLDTHIITAAEQQTMNYYMNQGQFYKNEAGRKLYAEIGMVEEDHVTQYGGLQDPNMTWLECNLLHEYIEAYLYFSMQEDESDPYIKSIWERCFNMEVAHLHDAARLLAKYEGKTWHQVIPNNGVFPDLLKLTSNKDYVRTVLANTVNNTTQKESYINVEDVRDNSRFRAYQASVNIQPKSVESHRFIDSYIIKHGEDYRYQDSDHPVKALQDRKKDNINVGVTG